MRGRHSRRRWRRAAPGDGLPGGGQQAHLRQRNGRGEQLMGHPAVGNGNLVDHRPGARKDRRPGPARRRRSRRAARRAGVREFPGVQRIAVGGGDHGAPPVPGGRVGRQRPVTSSATSAGPARVSRSRVTPGPALQVGEPSRRAAGRSSSRNVATGRTGPSRSRTARNASSSREDSSAQCRSSRTRTSGARAARSASSASTRTNRRCRAASMSPGAASASSHAARSPSAATKGP